MTYLPPSITTFDSVEQVDAWVSELGWPLEYRQIEPGKYSSTFTDLDGDGWFLMEEQSSRRLEIEAGAVDGMIVLALVEGDPATINGQVMNADCVYIQTPGSSAQAVIPAGLRITQVGVPCELFEEALRSVAPDFVLPHGQLRLIDIELGRFAASRRAMRSAMLAPSSREATREESVSWILADMIEAFCSPGAVPTGSDLSRAGARRAFAKAREYIEANLNETIRIANLCAYAGTTVSTLERVFSRQLGVTPQQYVMARRLNSVRRRLLGADTEQGVRVTDVAQDHGFDHLGRFAGYYRRYFGETPVQTLQAS